MNGLILNVIKVSYGVPELIFYQESPRIHALLLWKTSL